jgi:hypothetical protein
MKRIAVFSLVFLLLTAPASLFARGETVGIEIEGPDLAAPIQISDRKVLADFKVRSGIGTSSNEPGFDPTAPSFIVDWSEGPTSEPPKSLPRYQVLFYANLPTERLAYAVVYAFDPVTGEGYVYLPGKGDENYRLNVHTIVRKVEGKWFHSWDKWDSIAQQLIEPGRRKQPLTTASVKP